MNDKEKIIIRKTLVKSETNVRVARENVENYALLTKPASYYLLGVITNLKDKEIPVYNESISPEGFIRKCELGLPALRDDVVNLSGAMNDLDTANAKLNIAMDEMHSVQEKDLEFRKVFEVQIRELNHWGKIDLNQPVWSTKKCIRHLEDASAQEEIGIEEVLEAQLHTEDVEAEIREQDISESTLGTSIGKMKPTRRNLVDTE